MWCVLAVTLLFTSVSMAQSQGEESADSRWFTMDAINTGLGDVPEEAKRMSPRETIRSFLNFTEEENYADAAHLLNLADGLTFTQ